MTGATEAARALAAQRKHATYECTVCGKAFKALQQSGQRTPVTCSQSCRSKRWREQRAKR